MGLGGPHSWSRWFGEEEWLIVLVFWDVMPSRHITGHSTLED